MARDGDGVASLFVAIEQNDHERAKHLMEAYHISPNASRTKIVSQKETQTYTPLYLAASLDRSRICDFLLSQGADPYGKMVYGMYPMHVACDRVFVDVLEVFLQHSCDQNRKDDNGDTPLHLAALRGSVECVHLLTLAGADLDARNKAGKTPFEEAVQHQRRDVVRYLRDHCVSKQKYPAAQGTRTNTQDGSKELRLAERERLRDQPSMKALKSKSKSCDYPEGDTDYRERSHTLQSNRFPRTIIASTYRRHSAQRGNSFCERSAPDASRNGTAHISLGRKDGEAAASGRFRSGGGAGLLKHMRERHDHDRRVQKSQSWPFFNPTNAVALQSSTAEEEEEASSVVLQKRVLRQKVDDLLGLLTAERGQQVALLSASFVELLPPLASCLKLSQGDVIAACKGQGPKVMDQVVAEDHGVLQAAELMKEWGYSILDEGPFRVELRESNALVTVYFHVKVKHESLLRRMDSRYAVLKMAVKCSNADSLLEEDIGCRGNLLADPVLFSRHTNLCSVYHRYHGSTAGFQKYLEATSILGDINLPARAQFSFQKNYKCSLKQLLERRHDEAAGSYNTLQGFTDIEILSIAFQLLLVCASLEENGVEGISVTMESVCITEEGTVLLDAEEAVGTSHRIVGKETSWADACVIEEENGYPETSVSIQSIGRLCQELADFTPLSLPSSLSSACSSGSMLAASLSHSEEFLSFLCALTDDSTLSSPRAGAHLAYCLLRQHCMSSWVSESKCQKWLASERLTLYFTLSTSDEDAPTDAHTADESPVESFFQRRLIDYLFLLQAEAKDLWCAVQAVQKFMQ